MKPFDRKSPFYFLRHAQTDHNAYHIYDDESDVELNQKGFQQALQLQQAIVDLSISTVCCSPSRRAQQTKEIVLKHKTFNDIVIDDFHECRGNLWRLFIEAESRCLIPQELDQITSFTTRVEQGLMQAFQYDRPLLIIAHGGTFWAISHLLKLEGDRKLDNCILLEIFPKQFNNWDYKFIT